MASGADAVVLDLEDAVAHDRKDDARAEVARLLDELDPAARAQHSPAVHVRVNADGDTYDAADLAAAVHPAVETLRIPKAESPSSLRDIAAAISDLEHDRGIPVGTIRLHATIESARGVLAAESIANCDRRITRLVLGQADLVADIGARGDDVLATLVARSLIVLASRAAGIEAPIDGATTGLADDEELRDALVRARALGFHGKSAIHPRQLAAIHDAFTPSGDEVLAAERILSAARAAGGAVTTLDGELVDGAIVRRAEGLLRLRRRP